MNVARLLDLDTGRLNLSENSSDTYVYQEMSRYQSSSVAGRIESMKNSYDKFGNRTRDYPPARRGLPQPIAPPRTPIRSDTVAHHK